MKNKVVNIFLFSLATSLAVVFLVMSTLSFVAPAFMAKKFDEWGMSSFAFGCYDHAYGNSDDINDQYFMFEKSVNMNYPKYISRYADKILSHSNLDEFCVATNSINIKKAEDFCRANNVIGDAKTRLLLSVMNEENYIKNKYVSALIQTERLDEAFNFAFDDIKDQSVAGVKYDDTFALSSVVKAGKKLTEQEAEVVRVFFDKLKTHVDALSTDGNGKLTTFKDMLICERLCEVASTLDVIYTGLSNDAEADNMKNAFTNYRGKIYG